jgi:hypothetical protein
MSDLNIRLLLHRLWLMWRDSGQEKERPHSFVFMPVRNPVQQVVLGQWDITVLSGGEEDPEKALICFLQELSDEVERSRGQQECGTATKCDA